ncbi:MAG: YceD family protein [Muribaculaceae bacterium]
MGKFSEFNLPLKSLTEGTHEFCFHLGPEFFSNMENTDIHGANLEVKLTVVYARDIYELSFHITGDIVLLCDRCLDEMTLPVDATYNINVQYGADYDDSSDNLLIIPESDRDLNVSYMIYDTVVLEIPIKHVHPAGKCNRQMSAMLRKHRVRSGNEDSELEDELIDEIDSMTDSDTPSDPRWDALKGLGSDTDD